MRDKSEKRGEKERGNEIRRRGKWSPKRVYACVCWVFSSGSRRQTRGRKDEEERKRKKKKKRAYIKETRFAEWSV